MGPEDRRAPYQPVIDANAFVSVRYDGILYAIVRDNGRPTALAIIGMQENTGTEERAKLVRYRAYRIVSNVGIVRALTYFWFLRTYLRYDIYPGSVIFPNGGGAHCDKLRSRSIYQGSP